MPFPQRLINLFVNAGSYSRDGIVATTYADDYIVSGNSFTSQLVLTAAAGKTYYLFDASGSDKTIFTIPASFSASDGPVVVSFRYAHDYAGGSALRTFNRNANSATANEAVLTQAPSGSDIGLVNSQILIGTSAGGIFTGGGKAGQSSAFIINNAVSFLIEVDNQTSPAAAVKFGYTFTWFEV